MRIKADSTHKIEPPPQSTHQKGLAWQRKSRVKASLEAYFMGTTTVGTSKLLRTLAVVEPNKARPKVP